MKRTLDFLKAAGIFYVATTEGDQPRVRPFGAVMEWDGKLYFCTNNKNDVYKQYIANPKMEICACTPDGKWIRLTGEAVADPNPEAKAAMLEASPGLKNMYAVDDGIYEVFYLQNAVATFCAMGAEPEIVKL
jgi:uncharacterized pyridoxamine 5'-phosphate oxidase family protein